MAQTFPRRDLVVVPFVSQLDTIEKLHIEAKTAPITSQYPRRKSSSVNSNYTPHQYYRPNVSPPFVPSYVSQAGQAGPASQSTAQNSNHTSHTAHTSGHHSGSSRVFDPFQPQVRNQYGLDQTFSPTSQFSQPYGVSSQTSQTFSPESSGLQDDLSYQLGFSLNTAPLDNMASFSLSKPSSSIWNSTKDSVVWG